MPSSLIKQLLFLQVNTMVLEALFTEKKHQIVINRRFSILSLNINFCRTFLQKSSLRIRNIKYLFDQTYSDNVSSSTLSFLAHCLWYS